MALPVTPLPSAPRKATDSVPSPSPSRSGKRRPEAKLAALVDPALPVADWASFFGDLTRRPEGEPVEWRVHDRTHIEFAIDYPVAEAPRAYTWEAYFFVPESFRMHEGSYDKKAIYDDLWSYVRYAVPDVPFFQLARVSDGTPLQRVEDALKAAAGTKEGSAEELFAMRMLRLFACQVRASGLAAMREIELSLGEPRADAERLGQRAVAFVATCNAVATALRDLLKRAEALPLPGSATVAALWVDEDVSMVLETLTASLALALERRSNGSPQIRATAERVAACAVKEARHRRDAGYDSVGSADAGERAVEHIEFRRHVLKRFTSSVLWLSLGVHRASAWVVHTLYAVAAAVAMAVALIAGLKTPTTNLLWYAILVVAAYALKDRVKAFLQNLFAGWIEKRFPDRKWTIQDRERGRAVGEVHERAAFLPFGSLPKEVLAARRMTREHPLEEQARPEQVLWHQKTLVAFGAGDKERANFPMLTEIFRLNLREWLSHADDPNRKMVFADPDDARIYSATARRVYNINVIYRLRTPGDEAPWQRLRVVVSRKGIERIEPIC